MFENLFGSKQTEEKKKSKNMFDGIFDELKVADAGTAKVAAKTQTAFEKVQSGPEWGKTNKPQATMSIAAIQQPAQPQENFLQTLAKQYTNPSETIKKTETLLGVGKQETNPIAKLGSSAYDLATKAMVRTFGPMLEPLGKDIGERIIKQELAPKIASGEMPKDVLDQFETLKKTNLQLAGDLGQAVLAAYSPTVLGKTALFTKSSGVGKSLLKGGLTGTEMGTAFGAAQAASSGSKDPKEIASIMATNIAMMGVLGAVTSGAVPVSRAVYSRTLAVKNQLKTEFLAKGYTPAEAERLANNGGYMGKTPEKAGNDMATKAPQSPKKYPISSKNTGFDLMAEARKYKTAEDFVKAVNTVNPSEKGVFQKYTPELRNKMPIGDNIQTLDKSIGGKPDDIITVYRGTSGNKINAGDFITTNKQLAKDYAGTGNIVELKVRKGDIIDTIDESGMEEYVYKPNADKLNPQTKSQLTDIWNKANKKTATGAGNLSESDLNTKIEKRLTAFRKEAGLMANKEGAGVRTRIVTDQVGNTDRVITDWNLGRAKASMARQKAQGEEYAHELLYENDPEFKALVDQRDNLLEAKIDKADNEIDVTKLFNEVDKTQEKIKNYVKQHEQPKADNPLGANKEEVLGQDRGVTGQETKKPIEVSGKLASIIEEPTPQKAKQVSPESKKVTTSKIQPRKVSQKTKKVEGSPLKLSETNTKNVSISALKKDITTLKKSQVNTTKLNISQKGKDLVNKTAGEIKEKIEKHTGKVLTNKEALATAEKSSEIMEKAVGREATLQWEASLLNARKKMAYAAQTGRVDKDFIDGLIAIKTQGTDIARKLQSFKIGADPVDNTSMQAIIEAVLEHTDKVDEVLKAAQGVDFSNLKQATEFYRKFVKPNAGEWIDLLRYNSMLSSPLTHIVNTFSNAVNTIAVKPIEKALAGGFDFLGSKITGKERTMFAGESGAYVQGYFKSAKEAVKRFNDVLQGKRVYTNLDVKQIPVAVTGKRGAIASTLSFPLRLLEASDQLFTALSEAGEVSALELRAVKGAKVGNIATQAQEKAAYTIYRQGLFNENEGIVLNAIDHFTGLLQGARNSKNPIVSTISKFTLPFIQTPMNIFKQGIEYSPMGFSTLIGAKNKTEQLTKAVMGSAVFAGAATMLASNRLSWGEPTDAKLKAEYRAAGKQPYSIKIGNNWVSYQKLTPTIAFPFAMIASVDDLLKNKKIDDTTADLILGGVAKFGSFLADQSYVKSVGDLLAAAKGDEYAITQAISNYPQQLIPFRALSGWMTRMADDTQRIADNKAGFIDQQMQWLMTSFPGLSQKVPARTDEQGNPIKQPNRFLNAFSPVKMSAEDIEKSKRFEELLNLKKLNQNETIESKQITIKAEAVLKSVKNASTVEEKRQIWLNAIKENPALSKKMDEIAKEEAKGLTAVDREIKSLGVENGMRAKYIIQKMKELPTKEEKRAFYIDLMKKGLISDAVDKSIAEQLSK